MIKHFRGDVLTISVDVVDPDTLAPADLNGLKSIFTLKRNDTDKAVIFTTTEFPIVDQLNSVTTHTVPPTVLEKLVKGDYVFDIEVSNDDRSFVCTVIKDIIRIELDVTTPG